MPEGMDASPSRILFELLHVSFRILKWINNLEFVNHVDRLQHSCASVSVQHINNSG
jgi:hypothetical protein